MNDPSNSYVFIVNVIGVIKGYQFLNGLIFHLETNNRTMIIILAAETESANSLEPACIISPVLNATISFQSSSFLSLPTSSLSSQRPLLMRMRLLLLDF